MALLVNAEQICKTPLKLCRHRAISATAAHFSMAATLAVRVGRLIISEATSLETSLKRFVIKSICGALTFLSGFIHACPRNSLARVKVTKFNLPYCVATYSLDIEIKM